MERSTRHPANHLSQDSLDLRDHGDNRDEHAPCDGDTRLRFIARATSLALVIRQNADIIDLDGRYRQLTGLGFDDTLESVHSDDRERTLQALAQEEAVIPLRLLVADGTLRHVEFRCVASDDELVIAVVDDEARAGRPAELEATVTLLAEQNADLDSFAHAAAHDLKAPLRAMMAFSELAAGTIDEGHPAQHFLDRIGQRADRMAELVDSLLRLASAGRDALAIGRCDLEPIVQQLRGDLSHEIELAGAVIEVDRLDPVLADPTALGVIMTNLVANSVKYRTDETPKIHISSQAHLGQVTITVMDNGIGFDQDKAAEIFEPFRRLHSSDQFEGCGIGLAVCRRLASRLDGKIWATALPGGGTVVSLRLPSPDRRV